MTIDDSEPSNLDLSNLVVVTPRGNIRPFDMMLSRALHIIGEYPDDPAGVPAWRERLNNATEQVLNEVDNDEN